MEQNFPEKSSNHFQLDGDYSDIAVHTRSSEILVRNCYLKKFFSGLSCILHQILNT